MEKDSVSRAPVWSCTWIVKVNSPSVVGVPVMPPEATPCVNNFSPGGICPETTLNWTGFSDVRQPVVEKNHVLRVPTLPSGNVVGTIVQAVVLVGGGDELTVQPDNLATVELPDPSLVPMATPSTVMVRLGLAWPSILSCVPLISAREMLTAAWARSGVKITATKTPAASMASATANQE